MKKFKDTFINKYGIWEYIVFAVGLIFIGKVTWSFAIANFDKVTQGEVGIWVLFFSVGVLAISFPMTILNFARKKAGLDVKTKTVKEEDNGGGAITPDEGF